MKKNTMMRLAAVMLMCVLLTTSVVGGTFAKYVTSDLEQDKARVAKWGVDVDVEADTAFATAYGKDDPATTIAQTVVSSNSDKLLAPGTKGTLCTAYITGKPEVAVHVECKATLELTGWVDDASAYYCPLVITIDGAEFNGLSYSSVDKFIADVKAKLDANYYVQANTDLTTGHTVEWSWPFSTGEANDKKDTDLGDAGTAKIDFKYEITVTQVD